MPDLTSLPPFHLAIPVDDLPKARHFYCDLLGCTTGREAARWIDLNFFGHQLTLHLVDDYDSHATTNPVDGDNVPARHFGAILPRDAWQDVADRLQDAGCKFLISPRVRFKGEVGEQATLFLYDPAGNALEFKSFADPAQIFAT
ncbi:MAG TPA: VOC family protein [Woeseiaceae bacterium]|nr:VOC family protein [Woeseiaceae bacterium]